MQLLPFCSQQTAPCSKRLPLSCSQQAVPQRRGSPAARASQRPAGRFRYPLRRWCFPEVFPARCARRPHSGPALPAGRSPRRPYPAAPASRTLPRVLPAFPSSGPGRLRRRSRPWRRGSFRPAEPAPLCSRSLHRPAGRSPRPLRRGQRMHWPAGRAALRSFQ